MKYNEIYPESKKGAGLHNQILQKLLEMGMKSNHPIIQLDGASFHSNER